MGRGTSAPRTPKHEEGETRRKKPKEKETKNQTAKREKSKEAKNKDKAKDTKRAPGPAQMAIPARVAT